MSKLIDLHGRRFGRLIVLERGRVVVREDEGTVVYWRCRCDCGTVLDIRGYHLRQGRARSCGCYRADENRARIARLTSRAA